MEGRSGSLPRNVLPLHYDLEIVTDLDAWTYSGSVKVEFDVLEETSFITLNSSGLDLQKAYVIDRFSGDFTQDVESFEFDEEREQVRMALSKCLPRQVFTLEIIFSGVILDKLNGFYRSGYEIDGKTHKLALTSLEPVGCRQAFPCWDEPSFRACFSLTLVVDNQFVALSNMPVESEVPWDKDSNKKMVRFQKAPSMASYLYAWIIGELDSIGSSSDDGVPIRVYAPVGGGKVGQCAAALDACQRVLSLFEKWFGIPYALPKLDLVAIPTFAAGAMENWGLITYRETTLLVDPEKSSFLHKARVVYVIAHEVAHQWFGNLVTMKWWNDLWLNEGFATWLGTQAVDELFPKWETWVRFVSESFLMGLRVDTLRNSHPIDVPVVTQDEIEGIFDHITYLKGACLIRMLVNSLGIDVFRNGIQAYLRRLAFKNSQTKDLFDDLDEAHGNRSWEVSEMMRSWIADPGYPTLSVAVGEVRDDEVDLELSQERFCVRVEGEQRPTVWWIPLGVTSSDDRTTKAFPKFLKEKRTKITVPIVGQKWWIKFNTDSQGFYRVKYDNVLRSRLLAVLQSSGLSTLNRLSLISDETALAMMGYSRTVELMRTWNGYVSERSYVVLSQVAASISDIKRISSEWKESHRAAWERLETLVRGLFEPVLDRLGWKPVENEGQTDALLRSLSIQQCAFNGSKGVQDRCIELFDEFFSWLKEQKGENPIAPDLRASVLAVAIRFGGSERFNLLSDYFENSSSQEERTVCISALGCTCLKDLREQILESTKSRSTKQEVTLLVNAVSNGSVEGALQSWKFIKENYGWLHGMFKGMFLFGQMLTTMMSQISDRSIAKEMADVLKDCSCAQRVKEGLESIEIRASWKERDEKVMLEYLEK